jgi:hypothetical protein
VFVRFDLHHGLAMSLAVAVLVSSSSALADATVSTQKLHAFPASNASGVATEGSSDGQLIVHSSGTVYGIRELGGTSGAGVFFRMTADGTFTVLHHFGASLAAGQRPAVAPDAIVEDAAGDIYIGLTFSGSGTGETGAGLVKYSPGTGTLTGLPPTADQILISGITALVDGGDGYVYGTADGGVDAPPNNTSNQSGVIFRILKSTGAQTALRYFGPSNPQDGFSPGSIVKGTDGYFYGHNIQAGGVVTSGTSEASGTLWRINPTGSTFQTLHLFRKADKATNGETPIALLLGADGYLWGQTQTGGTTNDMGTTPGDARGVLFRFTIATQTLTPVVTRNGLSRDFSGQSGGNFRYHPLIERGDYLYSIHPAAVYRFSKAGVPDSLHVFQNQDGIFLDDLAIAADGTLYALTGLYGVTSSTGHGSIVRIAFDDSAPLALAANPTTVFDGGGTTLTWESTGSACRSYGGGPYDGQFGGETWGNVARASSGCAQVVIDHGPYSGGLNLFYAMRCESGGGYVTASRTVTMLATTGTATGPACPGTGGGGDGGSGDPVALTRGTPRAISGATGSLQEFYLDVPAGATDFGVATTGGSGDLDLYVRFGARATTSAYTCKSESSSNNESCVIATPSAGRYYIAVYGYATFSGASIVSNYTPAATGGGGGDTDPPPDDGEVGGEGGGGGGGSMSLGLLLLALTRLRRR